MNRCNALRKLRSSVESTRVNHGARWKVPAKGVPNIVLHATMKLFEYPKLSAEFLEWEPAELLDYGDYQLALDVPNNFKAENEAAVRGVDYQCRRATR